MCGRYANFLETQALIDHFAIAQVADDARLLPPSWNVAPTQHVAIVVPARDDDPAPGRRLEVAQWGLVPSWAKDPGIGARMINARSETIAEKPSFRSAFAKRRCVVPASGYYEWRLEDGVKQPYWIHADDNAPLSFAGLYEFWKDKAAPSEDWLVTTTIVTGPARGRMTELHDREPIMVGPDAVADWLDRDADQGTLFDVIGMPSPEVTWHPVTRAVGSPRNNSAENIDPLDLSTPSET